MVVNSNSKQLVNNYKNNYRSALSANTSPESQEEKPGTQGTA